jgi:hypothetical protein
MTPMDPYPPPQMYYGAEGQLRQRSLVKSSSSMVRCAPNPFLSGNSNVYEIADYYKVNWS